MVKPTPYPKRWTLLFLGSHGRTRQFHHLKLVLVLIVVGFTFTAGAALYFYFQYQLQGQRLRAVEASLADARKSVRNLKKEKQALTLQLALKHAKAPAAVEPRVTKAPPSVLNAAEKKTAEETALKDAKTEEKAPVETAEKGSDTPAAAPEPPAVPMPSKATAEIPASDAAPAETPKAAEPPATAEKKLEAPEPQETAKASIQAAVKQPPQPAVVDVINFRLRKDATSNRWSIRFTIKRTAAATGKISGRAFVVLKDSSDNYNNWVCVPAATLIEGKPSPEQRGYTFAINNYLNARVPMRQQIPPADVKEAVVYIYDEKGSLLLEQTFPIEK